MKTVLLVTTDEGLRARLLRALGERSVFFASSGGDAVRTLRVTEIDLIVADATEATRDLASFVARARELSPTGVIVGITEDPAVAETVDFALTPPFSHRDLVNVLRHAGERHRLLNEVATLRSRAAPRTEPVEEPFSTVDVPASALEQALKELARALAAGFDLTRMLELFLDAVSEMVGPSRSAVLLAEPADEVFRIRAHRGLAPPIVESVRLPADSGLPQWLGRQARLLRLEEALRSPDLRTTGLARDLALVQAVVAIPLLARGELVGIVTLGERAVGGAYSRREAEILFMLGAQVGTAVRDIRLHNQLSQEKEFTEQILAHMSSGVITIDRDERVSSMNQRAEEILQLAADDLVGRDLRALPSPLGDLLFESLSHRRRTQRTEVHLALRNLPLEVSTYPITGDEAQALGAVLVFEDLSAQKALAAEKRQGEQLQLLTRVVASIADEIKNPLLSVNMLMELLEDHYDDPDFRRQFTTVVRRDVRRVVQVFERLTTLVNEGDLKFGAVDVCATVDEMLEEMGATAAGTEAAGASLYELADETMGKRVLLSRYHEPNPQLVKADGGQLKKAISYLAWYLVLRSPGDQAKLSISIARGTAEVQVLLGSRTASVSPVELQRLFDPLATVQESLFAVGPAVSQRIIEAQGGRLQVRQGRHELSFLLTLPEARE
jgi:PAS domain S-box-containing protein